MTMANGLYTPHIGARAWNKEFVWASVTLLAIAAYAGAIVVFGPLSGRQLLDLIDKYQLNTPRFVLSLTLYALVSELTAFLVLNRRQLRAVPGLIRQRWGLHRLLAMWWPLLALIILLPSFNVFKQTILNGTPFRLDPWLARLDQWLFLGHPSAGLWMHEHFGSPWVSLVIDRLYHAWFAPMIISVMLIAPWASPTLRARFMTCYAFSWIVIGSVLASAFVSAGPVFYPDLVAPHNAFAALRQRLLEHDQAVGQIYALVYQGHLLKHYGSLDVVIGGGISAMPSVHVALAVLFALACRHVNAWLGRLATLYATLIWIGSVYLGWHYATDGLLSGLLVVMCWRLLGALGLADPQPRAQAS